MQHPQRASTRRPRGLTLVETMVVIFVFALLTTVAVQLLLGGVRAWRKGQARGVLRSQARKALDEFAADFRQAISVTAPAAQTTTKVTTVSFTRPASGSSTNTVTVTYTLVGTTGNPSNSLVRTETGQSTVVSASNVVVLDPTSGNQLSYFQWADTQDSSGTYTGNTSLLARLYLSENPGIGQKADIAAFLATGVTPVSDVVGQTMAFYQASVNKYPRTTSTANPLVTISAAPANLGRPASPRFH